jgi:sugar phosphate isomerase/epimerase
MMPVPDGGSLYARGKPTRLALDHITVVDATPLQLADIAFEAGFRAISPFLYSLDVMCQMPAYDMVADLAMRAQFIERLETLNLQVDIAYPFTFSKRTILSEFTETLACAKEVNARFVNVLHYDRDPESRKDSFARFCDLANNFGLRTLVEFYPASQIRTLEDAYELVSSVGGPNVAGINVDILHLMRSGGAAADLAAIPPEYISYAQLSDGPAHCAADLRAREASEERMLPGQGEFDLQAFINALPKACPLSIEVPHMSDLACGVSPQARVAAAARAGEGLVPDEDLLTRL